MTKELVQLFDDLKGRYGISDEDMAVVTQAVDTTVAEAVAEATAAGEGDYVEESEG